MEIILLLAIIFIVMILVFFMGFGVKKSSYEKPKPKEAPPLLYGGVPQVRWQRGWQDAVAWTAVILLVIFVLQFLFW